MVSGVNFVLQYHVQAANWHDKCAMLGDVLCELQYTKECFQGNYIQNKTKKNTAEVEILNT